MLVGLPQLRPSNNLSRRLHSSAQSCSTYSSHFQPVQSLLSAFWVIWEVKKPIATHGGSSVIGIPSSARDLLPTSFVPRLSPIQTATESTHVSSHTEAK